jgi:hypothetical protein
MMNGGARPDLRNLLKLKKLLESDPDLRRMYGKILEHFEAEHGVQSSFVPTDFDTLETWQKDFCSIVGIEQVSYFLWVFC